MNTNKKGAVLWLTGLSGSGKSTIGNRLAEVLELKGLAIQRLDGNLCKACFGTDLNLDKEKEHDFSIKIASLLASVLEQRGIFVIASFLSPYKKQRDYVREHSVQYIEVYVKASLETCMERDPKGFYKKISQGYISTFPGFSYSYEVPQNSDVVIDTENLDLESCVQKILDYLVNTNLLISK